MTTATAPTTPTMLYKILTPEQWDSLPPAGDGDHPWAGAGIDLNDKFIHLSTAAQLPGTLRLFFASPSHPATTTTDPNISKPLATCDSNSLIILGVPRESLEKHLKWENDFPHVYAQVRDPRNAFTEVHSVQRDETSGEFQLPELVF